MLGRARGTEAAAAHSDMQHPELIQRSLQPLVSNVLLHLPPSRQRRPRPPAIPSTFFSRRTFSYSHLFSRPRSRPPAQNRCHALAARPPRAIDVDVLGAEPLQEGPDRAVFTRQIDVHTSDTAGAGRRRDQAPRVQAESRGPFGQEALDLVPFLRGTARAGRRLERTRHLLERPHAGPRAGDAQLRRLERVGCWQRRCQHGGPSRIGRYLDGAAERRTDRALGDAYTFAEDGDDCSQLVLLPLCAVVSDGAHANDAGAVRQADAAYIVGRGSRNWEDGRSTILGRCFRGPGNSEPVARDERAKARPTPKVGSGLLARHKATPPETEGQTDNR
eukprot:scaffold13078_cov118-Isochrysis_galbana.AAC.2